MPQAVFSADPVAAAIVTVRLQRVLLDQDLARLYGVETRALNQTVQRNAGRFPPDFMFRLTPSEVAGLRSQNVISNRRGGRRYHPVAFTEQGVAMLSSVLRSARAVMVNIEIMRTFVEVRRLAGANEEITRRIDDLEVKYDGRFAQVFTAIRQLVAPPHGSR